MDFPFYSVDSSSWGQGHRFGAVPVFDERKRKFLKLGLGDEQLWRKHAGLIGRMGYDWQDFADRERNDRKKICGLAAYSYILGQEWLKKRHGEILYPNNPAKKPGVNLRYQNGDEKALASVHRGLKLYLADATPNDSPDIVLATQSMLETGGEGT